VVVGQSEPEGVEKADGGVIVMAREENRRTVGKPVVEKQQVNPKTQQIPVYKSREEDRLWAKSGMVATVFVGESAFINATKN